MRSWLISLICSLVLACDTAAQQVDDVAPVAGDAAAVERPRDASALFAKLAEVKSLEARFVEEKHLALLAVPLTSRGRLHYQAPGYLARVVEEPEPATLLITPKTLRVTDRNGTETIDLRTSNTLRLFVTSLVRVFSGDEKALAESYAMRFEAPPGDATWTLTLTPRAAPLTEMIRALELSGTGVTVTTIVVREPSGDRSVMTIRDVDPQRVYTADEQRALFGITVSR